MEADRVHTVGDVFFVSSLCVMCVLCVAGNVTVILTILGTPKLRSGSSLLLFNLGVSDLLNGTIRITVVADSFLRGYNLNQVSQAFRLLSFKVIQCFKPSYFLIDATILVRSLIEKIRMIFKQKNYNVIIECSDNI